MSKLAGVRIVEFEGLGPGPFCGMLLADLGADVTMIGRQGGSAGALFNRGKKSIVLDLKNPAHVAAAVKIGADADAVIEGLRPGVMERLGLGPDVLMAANPKLVYGRITGWGQDGPWAHLAGHDVNYASLAGANWYSGQAGAVPVPPPTLVGDVGGGALYLALGILAGVLDARATGKGAVVDAAIVDGAAHLTSLLLSLRGAGGMPEARGGSMLDGAPFYDVYQCADDGYMSVGALEPKFYFELLQKLDLAGEPDFKEQYDQSKWPACRARLKQIFASKPRAHWEDVFTNSDACVGPVLAPSEAAAHPHIAARSIYRDVDGVLHAAAAPRFDGETPADPRPSPIADADADEILARVGLSKADLD